MALLVGEINHARSEAARQVHFRRALGKTQRLLQLEELIRKDLERIR